MSQITQEMEFKLIKPFNLWLPMMFVLVTGGIFGAMIFAMLGYQLLYFNRAYPGVMVADMEVGGMSPATIAAAVTERAPNYLARPVVIRVDDEIYTFTGEELGLKVDADLTATRAYAIGRSDDSVSDMLTHISLLKHPQTIDPIIIYDSGPTSQLLQQLADQVYVPPLDSRLIIHPDGRVEVTSSRWGRQMHPEATRALIERAIFAGDGQPVAIVTQQIIPSVRELDLEPARRQAVALLENPLTVGYTTEEGLTKWSLDTPTMRTLLSLVETVDDFDKTHFSIGFDEARLRSYLEQLAVTIQAEPIDADLAFDDEANELVVVQPSRDGRALDIEQAYERIVNLDYNEANIIELPLILTPPEISSNHLATLGIKEVVSESTSYFYGSNWGRMNNIELAASKFNGLIIPPGEIFSFNHYLGEVTAENGYDESLIIGAGRTAVGIGGGVCQVSTTVFRAAFFGGFEIVERWAHGYRVGWYETNSSPGLDATIYTPHVDFKFRNDTDYHLLIQTETDLDIGTVTFRFYSTNTNREVIVGEPEIKNEVEHGPPIYEKDPSLPKGAIKQVDWAKDGLDVSVTRLVKQGDKIIHDEVIYSHYQPWRAIYKVGTEGDIDSEGVLLPAPPPQP